MYVREVVTGRAQGKRGPCGPVERSSVEARERSILSLSGAGRVQELQLRYRVNFRLTNKDGRELIAADEILLKGKSRPTKIYAIAGDEAAAASPEFAEWSRLHSALLAAIKAGHVREANAALAACRGRAEEDLLDFYRHFADQIAALDTAALRPPNPAGKLAHQ